METTCWKQGLALNDLKYAEAYVLDLEKNGESIYVEMKDNEDNEEKNTSLTELHYKGKYSSEKERASRNGSTVDLAS